jgi:hypothetical protein
MMILARVQKSPNQEIRISFIGTSRGASLDIRVFVPYSGTGELGPTKSGLRVSLESARQLSAALDRAIKEVHVALNHEPLTSR